MLFLRFIFFFFNCSSTDDVKTIKFLGLALLILKMDVRRTFHQLKVDSGNVDLLCLKHGSNFIHQSAPLDFSDASILFIKLNSSIL